MKNKFKIKLNIFSFSTNVVTKKLKQHLTIVVKNYIHQDLTVNHKGQANVHLFHVTRGKYMTKKQLTFIHKTLIQHKNMNTYKQYGHKGQNHTINYHNLSHYYFEMKMKYPLFHMQTRVSIIT